MTPSKLRALQDRINGRGKYRKPSPKKRNPGTVYYTYRNGAGIDACLRNGSFLRVSKNGIGQFMNGDFMGFLDSIDEAKYVKVETEKAEGLIPVCCGGRR